MYDRFRELLERTGKNVRQVSRETGISESALSMWKKRQGTISIENAVKIADCFGITLDELVGHENQCSGCSEETGN